MWDVIAQAALAFVVGAAVGYGVRNVESGNKTLQLKLK